MKMNLLIDASIDRQRVLWVATCARFPEFVAEAATIDQLREKFADALEGANLPPDSNLQVRFHYDHGSIAAAVFERAAAADAAVKGESG
jgi:hypothetical protein